MPTTLIFTGAGGPSIAIAAAATALHAASATNRTLLMSIGHAPGMGKLLGSSIGHAPSQIAPHLDVLLIDPLVELADTWQHNRQHLPASAVAIAGDELPLFPGMEMLFGLMRLHALAPAYQTIVLDAGPHDILLRALAAPDALRWAVRLIVGLDRGPGKSAASQSRALVPLTLIPNDAYAGVQDVRVYVEQLRDTLIAPGATALRYVLRPDAPALADAQIAVPALQLHGLAVQAIVAGPLLPEALAGTALGGALALQNQLLAEAHASWPARPLARFDLDNEQVGLAALRRQGKQLAATPIGPATPPITPTWQGAPAVAIALPGLPKGALQLTISGDELIVRVGPYRRHILLPEALRGGANIKATREGEYLVVRRR